MSGFRIAAVGDASLVLEFPPSIDETMAVRCAAIAERVRARRVAAVIDVVPTFHTVAVSFDPLLMARAALERVVRECGESVGGADVADGRIVEVPVRYGGDKGPDLPSVAAFAGCSEAEVVRFHSGKLYRVYMFGFLPGFAYLGTVDERIAAPRLPTPRPRVAAGSVAIAGAQTGVYPFESPGGWQIVGNTALQMYAPDREEPFLFRPADRVRFVPVD